MSPLKQRRSPGVLALALLTTGSLVAVTAPAQANPAAQASPQATEELQILAFNDFHGNLAAGSSGTGGAAYLDANMDAVATANSIRVSAGDNVGGSPLLSAAFQDEPTIEALNMMGVEVSAVGNHEFDEGYEELLRLDDGGCMEDPGPNQRTCAIHDTFEGADFDYLGANVSNDAEEFPDRRDLVDYTIADVNGIQVAFVGLVLEDTPNIVTAEGVQGLTFADEVEAANGLVDEITAAGAETIVAVVHEGGSTAEDGQYACQTGGSITGPVVPIAEDLSAAYDLVISSHTHQEYICTIPDPAGDPRLVTQAASSGQVFTEITLQYDTVTGEVDRDTATAVNHVNSHEGVAPDAEIAAHVQAYQDAVQEVADRPLGEVTEQVTHARYEPAVSPLGRLIADAQLAEESLVWNDQEPVIAFMNPGGIRVSALDADEDGTITYGEAFTAQPFNNYLVSMTLTGADIHALLEQQWSGANAGEGLKFLQTSTGFGYAVTSTDDPEVVEGSVRLHGEVIAPDETTYRIVTNNFLAGGGDAFAAFTNGTDVHYGALDIDAFASYLEAHSPYTPVDPDVPELAGADRIGGGDRWETAAMVSRTFEPGVPLAFVATGTAFADALSGAALAGSSDAPVLLTKQDALPSVTAEELERLQPQQIVVLGGEEAVSEGVATALEDYATADTQDEVLRVSGGNRYATAAAVSQFHAPGSVVYLATGHAFPDALTGAARAGAVDSPVLLTTPGHLPRATREALQRLQPASVIILGGEEAVSETVQTGLADYTSLVTRVEGTNRYETATELSSAYEPGVEVVYVATGVTFPDGLAASALAGSNEAPVLLTKQDALPSTTRQELQRLQPQEVVVIGGTAAVSQDVAEELGQYLP